MKELAMTIALQMTLGVTGGPEGLRKAEAQCFPADSTDSGGDRRAEGLRMAKA
jgi:hypothetical protein